MRFILFLLVLMVSCGPSKEEMEARERLAANALYKSGDIVYLKPDSVKAVIIDHKADYKIDEACGCYDYTAPMIITYSVRSKHGLEYIKESLIYLPSLE